MELKCSESGLGASTEERKVAQAGGPDLSSTLSHTIIVLTSLSSQLWPHEERLGCPLTEKENTSAVFAGYLGPQMGANHK